MNITLSSECATPTGCKGNLQDPSGTIHRVTQNKHTLGKYTVLFRNISANRRHKPKCLLVSLTLLFLLIQFVVLGQTTMARFQLNNNSLTVNSENVQGTPTATNSNMTFSNNNVCEGNSHLYSDANTEYLDIFINAAGYSFITFSWGQKLFTGSGSGSGTNNWNFEADYNNDNTVDFTSTNNPSPLDACSKVSIFLPSIFNNQTNVRFRIQRSGTGSRLLYLDDIIITGYTIANYAIFKNSGSNNFKVPSGITSITVSVWGAGGGGGTNTTNSMGGGGGGAFATRTLTVTAGANYDLYVGNGGTAGTNGESSWFNQNSLSNTSAVVAAGGSGATSVTGASGGTTANSNGSTKTAGGAGGSNNAGDGGGGGGQAGCSVSTGTGGQDGYGGGSGSWGGLGGGQTGNLGTCSIVGSGGNGGSDNSYDNSNGKDGQVYGGGGGGCGDNGNSSGTGGTGADGQIVITWTCSTDISNFSTSASSACAGSASTITVTSTTIADGSYTVYYNLSGANTATGQSSTMNFSGTSGTFSTGNLANGGSTSIEITSVGCAYTSAGNTSTFTVSTPPTAPTSISGTTTICNLQSTTLTASGGSEGSGCTYQWYAGGCGSGGVLGTGSTLNVSPTTSTTYYVRRVGTSPCNGTTTSCASVTVNVSTPPTAPTSITGTTTICNLQSTTLTASGGTEGSGCTYQWYAGGCGSGSVLGTNSTLSVSPTTNTTYYVRRVGTSPCNGTTTDCASVTVNVSTPPTAPTSITGTTTVCDGQATTLTASGGTEGSGCTYQWYAGGCGSGSILGTNSSLSVSPTINTTYYVRRVGNAPCDGTITNCASVSVTVNSRPNAAITSSNTSICSGGSTDISGTITASGAWTLTLSSGGTVTGTGSGTWSKSVSPATATTYTISSLVDANCTSIGADLTGSTQVTVNTLPTFTTSNPVNISCYGLSDGSIQVNITGGVDNSAYTFSVTNGAPYTVTFTGSFPDYTLTGLAAGTLKIRVKDKFGCESVSCP